MSRACFLILNLLTERVTNSSAGEGNFNDDSAKPSGAATPIDPVDTSVPGKGGKRKGKGLSKKAKTAKQRLAIADGAGDMGMGGV